MFKSFSQTGILMAALVCAQSVPANAQSEMGGFSGTITSPMSDYGATGEGPVGFNPSEMRPMMEHGADFDWQADLGWQADMSHGPQGSPDVYQLFDEHARPGKQPNVAPLDLPAANAQILDTFTRVQELGLIPDPLEREQELESHLSSWGRDGLLAQERWSPTPGADALVGEPTALFEQLKQLPDFALTPGGMPGPFRPFLFDISWIQVTGGEPAPPVPFPSIVAPGTGTAPKPVIYASLADANSNSPARCSGALSAALAQDVIGRLSYANCVEPRSFPSAVALRTRNGGVMCSGVLIGQSHIATAAHCFCQGEKPYSAFFGERGWSTISPDLKSGIRSEYLIGDTKFADPRFCEKRAAHYKARAAKKDSVYPSKDLATVRILTSLDVALVASIFPLEPLWGSQDHASISTTWVVGYGAREMTKKIGEKIFADLRIDSDACMKRDECHASEEFIAAGLDENDNADSCFGDSGAPVYIDFKTDDDTLLQRRVLAGIVSRAVQENGECGKGGIYTDLRNSELRTWLDTIISNP